MTPTYVQEVSILHQ